MEVLAGDPPPPGSPAPPPGACPDAPYERDATVLELFERAVDRDPEAVAVCEDERAATYLELDRAANRIAHELLRLGRPARVGVAMDRSLETVAALLGVLKAGAAYVPLDCDYPRARLEMMLADTAASAILVQPQLRTRLPASAATVVELDREMSAVRERSSERPRCPATAMSAAYVMYTSGSTGRPKGVEVPHRGIVRLVRATNYVELDRETVMLQVGPLSFDPSTLEIWGPLLNGGRLAIYPPGRPEPGLIGAAIRRHRANTALLVSGLLHQVLDADVEQLRGLRQLLTGGDTLSPAHAARVLRELPDCRLVNLYGPTESTLCASFHVVGALAPGRAVPIGRPIAHTTVHLLDEHGGRVAAGGIGEICIGGDGLALGYVGDRELSRERFVADPFGADPEARLYRTGDLGRMDANGDLEFLGRGDDQVKIRGYRVEPGEVQAHVLAHPALADAAVLAREDLPGHRRLVAYVVARNGATPSSAALRAFLRSRLPDHMIPSAFLALERLPLTATGKLDRAALPAPGADDRASARGRGGAPRTGVEREVAALWMELLRVGDIRREDDFFELGGDSLLGTLCLARLRGRGGQEVPLQTLFEAPTLAGFAARLGAFEGSDLDEMALPPLPAADRALGARAALAPSQRPAWFFGRMAPESVSYQFQAQITLRGPLDPEALERALGAVIARHEILRTSFHPTSGGAEQAIHAEMAVPLERLDIAAEATRDQPGALERLRHARFRRPFNPERLPLVRWTLVRLAPEHHVLLHVEHHLLHDGWSFNLLLGELAACYRAELHPGAGQLAAPTLQFGQFAEWQDALADSETGREQLRWWREQLRGVPELELARGRAPREQTGLSGGMIRRALPAELTAGLGELAAGEGSTLFMVMLACFAELLRRHSGQEDFAIGTGAANRRLRETAGMLGMVVNTVAIRLRSPGPQASVGDLLRQTRDAALGALAHQDLPFEQVVRELAPPRRAGRLPLCQVLFSFHDSPAPALDLPGLEVEVEGGLPNGSAKADLNVVVVNQAGEPVTVLWEYDRDVFDAASAELLLADFIDLLELVLAGPDAPLASLLAGGGEAAIVGARRSYERESSIAEIFRARALENPAAIAVRFDGQRLSYAELERRANRLAHRLRALGVRRGTRVGVCMERSLELVVALLAVAKADGAYVPLDPLDPSERIGNLLDTLGVELLLSLGRHRENLPEPASRLMFLDDELDLAREPDDPPPSEAGALDPAYVIFTSGSTGAPKGVEVPHRAIARLVRGADYVRLGPERTLLGISAVAFDAATFEFWGALLNGAQLALAPPGALTLGELESVIGREGVDTMFLTTGLFRRVVDDRPGLLAGVRQLLTGGEAASADHIRRALAQLPADGVLVHVYGPTEATTFTTAQRLHPGDVVPDPVPIGTPIANTHVHILDEAHRAVADGAPGELCIGGDGVALGYCGDPALNAERFPLDPHGGAPGARMYRSGDLARRRGDGTIEFLGRRDRQLKIRGFRVEPAEIEAALRCHPGVADAAVVPLARSGGARVLAAHVVPSTGAGLELAVLRAHAARTLPAHAVPSAWGMLESLPLNANGKLDASALPAPVWPGSTVEPGGRRPSISSDRLVGRLISIWERALDRRGIGADDDFFDVGGHSLLAVEMFEMIERDLGIAMPLASIFQAPTPRLLADSMRVEGWKDSSGSIVTLTATGQRSPLFFVAAGDGNPVGYGALARRLGPEQPFFALQPRGLHGGGLLHRTVEAMAAHYVREVRRVRPHGPYLLGGRCLGGVVAYEMARRLRDAGQDVALLAILDSAGPWWQPRTLADGTPYDPVINSALRRPDAARDLGDVFSPAGTERLRRWLGETVLVAADGTVIDRYLYEAYRLRGDVRGAYPDLAGEHALWFIGWAWTQGRSELGLNGDLLPRAANPEWETPPPTQPRERLARARRTLSWRSAEAADLLAGGRRDGAAARRRARVQEVSRRAWESYRAGRYDGEITLIRSEEHRVQTQLERWHGLHSRGVIERVVPGTHRSMMREPDVGALAECLAALIATAR